jgi:hypothetical protein
MTTVTKVDIEDQLVGCLTNDGLYDRPVPVVRKAVMVTADVIAEALGLEDSEGNDELEGYINFTRRCCKVRECDRMDLASSVRAVLKTHIGATLSTEDQERLAARVTGNLTELVRRE